MNLAQQRLEIGLLLGQEAAHVTAWCGTGAPEADDVLDLPEGEAQPLALLHEGHDAQHVIAVLAVARVVALRRRKDSARFADAERLAAGAAPLHHLTDSHGGKVHPAPWGRVKSACSRLREI